MININFFKKRNIIEKEVPKRERKMSNSKTRGSIADMVAFIKEKTIENIVNSSNSKDVSLTEEDLNKIINLVDSSVSQAFMLSIGTIEKSLSEIT